jgi:adenosylhomocysteine nucleosidase
VNARNLLILTPLKLEARAISRELGPDVPEPRLIGIRASRLNPDWLKGYSGLILAGLAGALDPNLQIGDVIACIGNGNWPPLSIPLGKIHTSPTIISTPTQKADLFRQTAAQAVDMEHQIVAQLAIQANLPMISIRAISDTAHESLPPELAGWINDIGQPKPASLALGLATHPGIIPPLMRLGKNSRLAAQKMAQAVHELINKCAELQNTPFSRDPKGSA